MLATALLTSCTVGPNYHPATPSELKVPEQHYSVQNHAAAAVDLRTWRASFNDPILSGLVASALSAKKDIDAALALRARAALLPVIGIVFGFFQGRRAASLNPIDALRHE